MPFPDATDVVRTRDGDTWTRDGRPFWPIPSVRACTVRRDETRALLLELDEAWAPLLDADRAAAGDHVVASFARGRLAVDRPAGSPYRGASEERDATPFALLPILEGGTLAPALLRARNGLVLDASLVATLAVELAVGISATPTLTTLTPTAITIDGGGRAHVRGPLLDALARAMPSAAPIALPYTAPESMRGDSVAGERSRLFSLGVMLHELLAGAPLFANGAAGLREIGRWSAPPLATLADAPELRSVLWMLLQRDPHRRGSARGVVELLAKHHTPRSEHAILLLGATHTPMPYFTP